MPERTSIVSIEIANVRTLPPPAEWPPWMIYVGRACPRKGLKASPLANPYRVGQWDTLQPPHTMDVEQCVYRYRFLLPMHLGMMAMLDLRRLRALLAEYGRLTLVCFCETWDGTGEAPGKCHAEVVREYLLAQK